MILAVDVGNTNIVLGGYEQEKLCFSSRLSTEKAMEADQYALQLRGILDLYDVAPAAITGIVLSSVVPPITDTLARALRRFTDVEPLLLSQDLPTGVEVCIDNPRELGTDLLAGAIGAKAGYPLPAVVLDLGTATKLTAVDGEGRVQGVSIMPGVFLSLNALVSGASQLGGVALRAPGHAIGKNTAESMQSGMVLGAASMLDGMLDRFEEELGGPATLLACGGAAGLIVPYCRHKISHVPTLILDGLYAVYKAVNG